MKKRILSAVMMICMMLMLFPMVAEASSVTTPDINSQETVSVLPKDENGVITLTGDVVLTSALAVNDGSTLIIDLNGHELQLTKPGNYIKNGSKVIIKSSVEGGILNVDGVIATGDCIIGVGDYSTNGTLTLENIKLTGTDYSSAYAVIYVYGESTLNIKDTTMDLVNDASSAGGAIKTEEKTKGIINIVNSTLNLTDTVRGIVDGMVTIDNSTVVMTSGTGAGLDNGINSTTSGLNLTIKNNSTVEITGYTGRGITIDGDSTITVIDSNVTAQGVVNSEGGIMFKASATAKAKVSFEGTSSLITDSIVVKGANADVNFGEDTTLAIDTISVPETVAIKDVVTFPTSYDVSEDGTVVELPKIVEMNGKQYATVQAAVNAAGTNTSKITLLGDAASNGFVVKAGQDIVFDFAGYTYTINGELVGSEGTRTLSAQLLKDATVTFKNGTLTSTNAKFIVQNYCDLTLENFNVDGTQSEAWICTISNNNGSLTVKGDSDILGTAYPNADCSTLDLYYWPNGGYDTVNVVFDETYAGTVVGNITYGPDAGANASDDKVAEKLSLAINGKGNFDVKYYGYGNDMATANIQISSGTFTEEVPKEYLVSGVVCAPVQNGDEIRYVVHAHVDGVTLIKTDAIPTSCSVAGNINYWTCNVCDGIFSDVTASNKITVEDTVIKATGHTVTKTDAVAPKCEANGNITYWTCSACTKIFSDEEATTQITAKDTVLAATGHTVGKTIGKNEPTCVKDGYTGDVLCSVCNNIIPEKKGKAIPATGIHTYLDGVCTMCQTNDPDYKPAEKVEMGTTDTMKDTLNNEATNITDAIDENGKLSDDIKVDEETKAKIEEVVKENAEDNSVIIKIVVEQVATPVEESAVPETTTTAIETGLDAAKQEIAENSTEDVEEHGIVQYLDLSVLIKAHNETEDTKTTLGELKETKNEMEFTITIPDEYLKPGYELFVLRYHDGQVDKLPLRHVEGNIYAFSTNKFSSYALAYVSTHVHTETIINAEGADCGNDGYTGDVVCSTCNELLQEGSVIHADGNHNWSEWKNQEGIAYTFRECWGCGGSEYLNADAPATNTPATGTGAPATGDTSNMLVWVLLMAVCYGAVIGTMVYRKNK